MDTGRVDPRVGSGRIGSGRVTGQHQGKFGGSGRVRLKFLKCVILFFIGRVKYFYPLLRKLSRPIVNNSVTK